jgi:hypothetical protein
MFDDFSYGNYRVRAGVQHRGAEELGKWYGVISLQQAFLPHLRAAARERGLLLT